MGCFPLFIELSGRKVLITGGGRNAERKAEILLRFGAAVTLVTPSPPDGCIRMADGGRISLLTRDYRTEDLEGAALAVSVSEDRTTNERIYADAVSCGIPVNVEDRTELCTFLFPAVVSRGDFAVGITTSGSYPALSRYARETAEAVFPESYEGMTEILKEYRKKIRRETHDTSLRRKWMDLLLAEAVRAANKAPEMLAKRIFAAYESLRSQTNGGTEPNGRSSGNSVAAPDRPYSENSPEV